MKEHLTSSKRGVLRQIEQRKMEHKEMLLKFQSQHLWTANP